MILSRAKRMLQLWLPSMLIVATSSMLFGGDWPQILGPNRDGNAIGEELADDWSNTKPTELWQISVGQGYAGPVVKDNRVLVFHRKSGNEQLDCVSAVDGTDLWSATWPASYAGGIDSDRGPRCVPLIEGKRVFVFGAGGDLHCADFETGEKLWSRPLGKEYKAADGYFGFGSSPILVGNHLMVNVGGRGRGTCIVSVDPESGQTQWTSFQDAASYSSPIAWRSKGTDAAIFVSRFHLVCVQPSDGNVLFDLPFGARGPTVNAASPVLLGDDGLFVTASYRIGAKYFLLNGTKPKLQWESDDMLSSQYPTPIYHDGHLYGVHGREDGAPASLRCVDVAGQKIAWRKNGVGMAHLIKTDDKLLVMTTDGELILAKLSPSSYEENGRVEISKATTRAMPALSNGHLFVKDARGKLTAWKIP